MHKSYETVLILKWILSTKWKFLFIFVNENFGKSIFLAFPNNLGNHGGIFGCFNFTNFLRFFNVNFFWACEKFCNFFEKYRINVARFARKNDTFVSSLRPNFLGHFLWSSCFYSRDFLGKFFLCPFQAVALPDRFISILLFFSLSLWKVVCEKILLSRSSFSIKGLLTYPGLLTSKHLNKRLKSVK